MSTDVATAVACPLCAAPGAPTIWTEDGFDLSRCRECGLVYVREQPSAAQLEDFYSFDSGYHRSFLDDPAEVERRMHRARRYASRVADHEAGGRLLDVGCSAGFFMRAAAERGWRVHGIELSADTAEVARERYGLDVTTGTLEDAPFEPGSLDAVTMWDLIEHVPDPVAAMTRVNELLAAGGLVGLITPNVDGAFPRVSYRLARRTGFWPHPEPPAHLFQFSVATLTRLLERTGFEVIEVRHGRIGLPYSFGRWRVVRRSPKRLAYAAALAPVALAGPLLRSGDSIMVFARKRVAARARE